MWRARALTVAFAAALLWLPGGVAQGARSSGGPAYPALGAALDTAAPHAGGGYEIRIGGNCTPSLKQCAVHHYPFGNHPVQLLVLRRSTLGVVKDLQLDGGTAGGAMAVAEASQSRGKYIEILAALPGQALGPAFGAALEKVTGIARSTSVSQNGGWAGVGVPLGGQPRGVMNPGQTSSGGPAGEIQGYFQQTLSTGRYSFVTGRYASYDTYAPGSSATVDVLKVGQSSYTETLPGGCSGGYALVVLNAATLQPAPQATQRTFATNCSSPTTGLLGLASSLDNAVNGWTQADGPLLVFLQSIGTPVVPNPQNQAGAGSSAPYIQALGGTAELWNRAAAAGTGYSLAGGTVTTVDGTATGAPAYAPEAATVIKGHPATLQGLLRGDSDWNYVPVTGASAQNTLSHSLATLVYGPSQPWPTGGTPAQQKILQYISDGMKRRDGTDRFTPLQYSSGSSCYDPGRPDVRFEFCDVARGYTSIDSELAHNSAVPSSCGCDQQDWTAVRNDLLYEISLRSKVISYMRALGQVYNSGSSCANSVVDLRNITAKVRDAVSVSDSAQVKGGFWTALVSDSFNMVSALSYSFPDYSALSNVLNDISAAGYLSGDGIASTDPSNDIADNVDTTAQQLGPQLARIYCTAENGLGRFTDVLLSNYGKLKAAGSSAHFQISLQTLDALKDKLNIGAKRFVYEHLLPAAYHAYTLLATSSNPTGTTAPNYSCTTGAGRYYASGQPWESVTSAAWTPLSSYDPLDPLGNRAGTSIVLSQAPYFGYVSGPTHPATPPKSLMQAVTGSIGSGGLGEYPLWLFLHSFPQYALSCSPYANNNFYGPSGS
jgi:hypothetical protein